MASQRVLGEMLVRIVGDNAEFDSSIDKSENKLEAFGKTASKIGSGLTKFITLPILAIGTGAVKAAADMETAQLSFETLLGSGEKAKVLLGQLKDFASTTPFEFQDLAQGTKTLLSFGIAAEEVLPITKQLGDIALGDSEKYKSLALVFGQISSTGRLMGQDLLQLINVGFNPLQEISRKTGESMADLKKRMEAGGISADEVAAAFKSATSEGGRFFEGTQKLGKSFAGQLSTLKDDVVDLARGFGEILLPVLKDIVGTISGLVKEFNKLDPETKKAIVSFALAAAAAGPLALGIGKVVQVIGQIPNVVNIARGAIEGLAKLNPVFLWAGAIGLVISAVAALGEAIRNINKDTEDAIAKEFGFKLFDQAKTLQENSAQFRIARGELNKYADTVKRLGGDLTNTEGPLRTTKQLTSEQLNELGRALSKYQLLAPTVEDFEEKLHTQLLETEKAKKAQDELNGSMTTAAQVTTSVSKAIAYQNDLIAKGVITEEEGLRAKIKIREEEIANIIKLGQAVGALTQAQIASIESLRQLNEDNAVSLAALSEGSQGYFDILVAGYIESARVAAETEEIRQNEIAATREAQAGYYNELIAGYKTDAQAAADAAEIKKNLIADVEKKRLEALAKEKKATEEAFSFTQSVYTSLKTISDSLFDAQLSNLEEGSAEYKRVQRDQAIAAKAIALFDVGINTARAVTLALASIPPPFGAIAAGIAVAAGAAQAGMILAQPIPQLAKGGIAMPTPGGTLANVAEAGQPEVIFPLDRLNEFLDNRGAEGAPTTGMPVELTIMLDKDKLYSGIFEATRNRKILIDAKAVV